MRIPAGVSHSTASRRRTGSFRGRPRTCNDRCALLLKGRGAPLGSRNRPGCRRPSDPRLRLLSKQNVDLQLIPAGRILSSVQEEVDMVQEAAAGTVELSSKKMVDKAIRCHHPCPALGGFQRPGKEKARSSAAPRRHLGLGASMGSAAPPPQPGAWASP